MNCEISADGLADFEWRENDLAMAAVRADARVGLCRVGAAVLIADCEIAGGVIASACDRRWQVLPAVTACEAEVP